MKRRNFLGTMAGAAILAGLRPAFGLDAQLRTLMVVQLNGGNDGLNTFIPYTDQNYYQLRPTIAIKNGIPISSEVALNPNMSDLKPLYDSGRVAIIQNVSYPNPNLSHFRARDIWMSARPTGTADSGWVARYLASVQAQTADAIDLGDEYPLALLGENREQYLLLAPGLSVKLSGTLGQAVQALYNVPLDNSNIEQLRLAVVQNREAIDKVAQGLSSATGYPKTDVGTRFALASTILQSQPKVLYMTIEGWDTHNDQLNRQGKLLKDVSQSLAALQNDLQNSGLANNVLILIFTEFGRRPAQNGSGGTDHGTGNPVVVIGNVQGGIYGGQPPLDSLVGGNFPFINDFRSIYAEILSGWEKTDPTVALGQNFPFIGFL